MTCGKWNASGHPTPWKVSCRTAFVPLTSLTGLFGMTFEQLPFSSPLPLITAVGGMVIIPGAVWLWMRRAR